MERQDATTTTPVQGTSVEEPRTAMYWAALHHGTKGLQYACKSRFAECGWLLCLWAVAVLRAAVAADVLAATEKRPSEACRGRHAVEGGGSRRSGHMTTACIKY